MFSGFGIVEMVKSRTFQIQEDQVNEFRDVILSPRTVLTDVQYRFTDEDVVEQQHATYKYVAVSMLTDMYSLIVGVFCFPVLLLNIKYKLSPHPVMKKFFIDHCLVFEKIICI